MDKLLQEAIADAKAVRETALANAKIALEEAFTPHLKSMLSKKLQAEMEGDDEEKADEGYHGEDEEEKVDEEMDSSGIGAADNKEPEEEASDASDIGQGPESEGGDEPEGEEDENLEVAPEQPMGEGMHDEDDEVEEGYSDEDEEVAEGDHMEDEDEDLEEVLRQLEAEMADEDDEMGEEEMEAPEMEAPAEEPAAEEAGMEDEEDEEIDLDEIIKALTEEGMEDEDEEKNEEAGMEDEESELEEYKKTVLYLKNKLSEVNLLNAKLLYTNKLFRSRNISEAQKMKVIEQFDRTTSVREVKLVYSTFAESMKRKPVNESARRKSQASKPITSTQSKKPIIGESTDFKSRMKKLANII